MMRFPNTPKTKSIFKFSHLSPRRNKFLTTSILLLMSLVSSCNNGGSPDTTNTPTLAPSSIPTPSAAVGSRTILGDEDGEKSVSKTDCDAKKIQEMKAVAKTDPKSEEFQKKIAECQRKNKAKMPEKK